MKDHFKQLLEEQELDILFFSETEKHRFINLFSEIGDERATYRAVQIRSTDTGRGGRIALIKIGLQLETAEIIRIHVGDEFAQAIILTDRKNRAFIGWCSPPCHKRDSERPFSGYVKTATHR